MACDIDIIINGEVIKTVHSDKELDDWIAQNQTQLKDLQHGFGKVFAINTVEETLKKIDKVESNHSNFLKNKNKDGFISAGVTTFGDLFGGLIGLKKFQKNLTEAEKEIHDANSKFGMAVGKEADEILSRELANKSQKSTYSLVSESMQLKLVDSIKKQLLPDLEKLGIKITDPNKQIKVQFGMSTNSFQDYILKAIQDSSASYESGSIKRAANLIRYIEGVADIVVIDDDGIIHVGDIKTGYPGKAEREVGKFILEEHKDYIAQTATYKEILRQNDIPTGTNFLVIYETDYDFANNGKRVRLKDINYNSVVPIRNTGSIQDAVQNAFGKDTTVTEGIVKKVSDVLNELFSGTNIATELKVKELDYDFMRGIIQKIPKNTEIAELKQAYNEGFRYYFTKKRSVTGENRNIREYGKTIGELTEDHVDASGKVVKSPFKQYVDLLNRKKASRFTNLAKDIMDAMSLRNLNVLDEVLSSISPSNKDVLKHHFKRFVLCNGKFKENKALNANGIYLFEKDDYLEVVVLDEENLINQRIKLLHGDSILGNFQKNSSLTDNRQVMTSDYGNLMLMKACALISLDPELTKNKKILSVRAMNLHNARVYEENNVRLINNGNHLARAYNRTHTDKLRTLGYYSFVEDSKALIHIADEFIECMGHIPHDSNKLSYLLKDLSKQKELTDEYILERIEKLEYYEPALKDFRNKNHDNPIWNAYAYLRRALLSLHNINLFQEKDLPSVMSGINPTGIRMRSFNSSNSPLARQMGETMANFRSAVRLEFVKEQFTGSKLLDEAFKERGGNGALGNDWTFFKDWFEQDENGKISSDFRLVRPNRFKGGPIERKAYEHFLEVNARYRGPDPDELEEHRDTDEGYEVPMIHAGFIEQFTAGKPLAALKYQGNKLKNLSLGVLMGEEDVEQTKRQLNNIDVDKLPDVIRKNGSERDKYVEKYGIDGIEKNLDFVFLSMLYSGIRSEKSPMFCEMFTSFLVVADYMMDAEGLDIVTIRDAMEDFIKTKLFSKDIRESKTLNALIGLFKNLTAKVALGGNTRAFVREVLTGQKKHFNRGLANADNQFVKGTKDFFVRPEFLEYSNFVSAYTDVISKIFDNASIFGLYHQLCAIYGMVNFSNEEMAEASKRHQGTVLGTGDKSSVTATAPDFLHRMAILVGHLKTIGAFDAYDLDDTGRLVYDMKKDSRFQTGLKYKNSEDTIPNIETRRKFNEEKQKYEEELAAGKNVGITLNYGDFLPQALSPTAAFVVKNYADEQYGNYDEETKSLVQKQTLGSLFLQYKTYGLAQFSLWFSDPTYTNSLAYINVTDEKGNKTVAIPTTPEEYEEYGDYKEKPEDEVTEEEGKRKGTRYIRQLSGDLFYGKAQTDFLLASKILTLKGDEFIQLGNENPEFRSNLYISMLDLLEMALIGILLRIFGNTDETPIGRQDFIHRGTYGVLQGMSTDGPLFQTLSGILGDGAPPVFGMVKGYYSTLMSVINGNTNLMYGLTNTVGMTRELSNLFRSQQ